MEISYFWFTEVVHFVIALGVGWWFYHKFKKANLWLCLLIGLSFGFFIDADHVIDYALYLFSNGHLFNSAQFIQGHYFDDNQRILILFHAWEWVAGLYLLYRWLNKKDQKFSRHTYILLAAMALLGHIISDQITNLPSPLFYFITYRAWYGFGLGI